MSQAKIEINTAAGSDVDLPINTLVQLSNGDIGDETSYAWAILDQPAGAADALSSAMIENPTFTPKKEGTYLIQLIVDLGLPTEDRDTAVAGIRQLKTRIRVPAAGETTEESTSRGWAVEVNEILQLVDSLKADPGVQVCQVAGAGVALYDVVRFVGHATIKSGLPGEEKVLTVDEALATLVTNVDEPLGLVIGVVDGSPIGVGSLVYVRRFGLQLNVPIATAPSVGIPLYVSNAGVLTGTPGTVQRLVGRVVSVPGPPLVADVYFDGAIFDFQGSVTLSNNNPSTIVPDAAAVPGAGTEASRDDHAHAIAAAAPGSILIGDSAAEGAGNNFARATHIHALAAPIAPVPVGTANGVGTGTAPAREDHVHDHGAQTTGTHHAAATTSVNGFMSAADKTQFDALGVESGSVTTTTATPTTAQTIAIPTNFTVSIQARIAAKNTGAAEGAGYMLVATYRNTGGTVTQIGSTNSVVNQEDTAAWLADLVISGTNVIVQVAGQAGKTIDWSSVTMKVSAT